MNKFYKLIFLIPILIFGCTNRTINKNRISQSINTLNMNLYSNQGKKLLTIKSPYSIYTSENNILNLKETTINLFKNNEIEYIINSNKSRLSNNNKLLELNGNVLIKSLIQQDDILYANSFRWNIQKSEYLLVGDVKFENKSITLTSNKAILNKNKNIIEFFNPVKYRVKDIKNDREYEINSENAYYNIKTQSVSFKSKEERVRSKISY